METWKMQVCTCGCGKKYPLGKSKPAGWKELKDGSVLRLTDNQVFKKGDLIKIITEQGKQYCDMVITDIDFYHKGEESRLKDSFYIRASTVNNGDETSGSTNITDTLTDYTSANNPNAFRFIQKI